MPAQIGITDRDRESSAIPPLRLAPGMLITSAPDLFAERRVYAKTRAPALHTRSCAHENPQIPRSDRPARNRWRPRRGVLLLWRLLQCRRYRGRAHGGAMGTGPGAPGIDRPQRHGSSAAADQRPRVGKDGRPRLREPRLRELPWRARRRMAEVLRGPAAR